MSESGLDFTMSIGGAAGQGIATPGNILARIFARRGLHLYAYNAYQSIIRGGHIFLTLRVRDEEVRSHGDGIEISGHTIKYEITNPVVRNGLGLAAPSDGWVWIFGWVVVVSTLVSMADRLLAFGRAGGSGDAPS